MLLSSRMRRPIAFVSARYTNRWLRNAVSPSANSLDELPRLVFEASFAAAAAGNLA
jgi:hypothetical protein